MKHTVGIKKTEKDLYRIFKELEEHGKSAFEYDNPKKQTEVARKIGFKAAKVKSYLYPPATAKWHRIGLVQTKNGVKVKEVKTKKGIRFKFYKE